MPDQALAGGVLELEAVEGRVAAIEVETDGRLRESYVRSRIEPALGPPVNVNEIENQLRILQQDARIRAVRAELAPGERRGEAVLRVSVVEARPWHLRLRGNDYASPVIGTGRGEVRAGWTNVTGFGDEVWAEYQVSSGLHDVRASWDVPLTRWDTRAGLHFRRTWSEVVEEPFDDLDIESRTETYGFGAAHPFYRTPQTSALGLARRRVAAQPFVPVRRPFSFVEGPEDGEAKLTALRAGSRARLARARRRRSRRARAELRASDLRRDRELPERIPDGSSSRGCSSWKGRAASRICSICKWSRAPISSSPTARCSASSSSRSADTTLFGVTARTGSSATTA